MNKVINIESVRRLHLLAVLPFPACEKPTPHRQEPPLAAGVNEQNSRARLESALAYASEKPQERFGRVCRIKNQS